MIFKWYFTLYEVLLTCIWIHCRELYPGSICWRIQDEECWCHHNHLNSTVTIHLSIAGRVNLLDFSFRYEINHALMYINLIHKCFFTNCAQHMNANFVIRNEIDQWNLEPWNIIVLNPQTSNFTLTNIIWYTLGRKLEIYVRIQSWQQCQYWQFCVCLGNARKFLWF